MKSILMKFVLTNYIEMKYRMSKSCRRPPVGIIYEYKNIIHRGSGNDMRRNLSWSTSGYTQMEPKKNLPALEAGINLITITV